MLSTDGYLRLMESETLNIFREVCLVMQMAETAKCETKKYFLQLTTINDMETFQNDRAFFYVITVLWLLYLCQIYQIFPDFGIFLHHDSYVKRDCECVDVYLSLQLYISVLVLCPTNNPPYRLFLVSLFNSYSLINTIVL